MSNNSKFFNHQTNSSRVKAMIISEYFPQYCRIISRKHTPKRFGYFDMFAGPGIYEDGNWSTPMLIAKNCYEDSFLRDRVWMVFNDMAYGMKLKENFEKYYESGTFANEPFFADRTFGEWPKIDAFLTRNTMEGFFNECPSVLFIDPWGYKHINTSVLAQFLTRWGNEVFIFVNTKRLNAAFEQPDFQDSLKTIFPLTYQEVKNNKKLVEGPPVKRHRFIINHLADEFRRVLRSTVYYTAFEFREEDQDTPSHYLLHITKGSKGFELIKQVYTKYGNVPVSLGDMKSVETYVFDPKWVNDGFFTEDFRQENITKLKNHLLKEYSNKRIAAETLFNEDQKRQLHSRSHYLVALRQLCEEKKIDVQFTDGRSHKVSVVISPSCIISFNKYGSNKD